jgi:arylsulfatase A-like enzyme
MNAICLVIDRLHCGYLGCYGNTWVGTPGLDRLASESFVLDGAYIDSPQLDSLYRSYWLGEHALARGRQDGRIGNPSYGLPQLLSAAGVSTGLVTDATEVARHPLTAGFGQCVEVSTDWPARPPAELEDTQMARFFSAVLDALRDAQPPFLLWLHSQGMAGPWDAPRDLRERYVAEDDPSPPDFTRPPALRLPAEPDPDELLGIRQAYAAQVAVLGACVETLADALRESKHAGDTLLVLLSARGYCLGVHGMVGTPSGESEPLYGELTSIPWLVRFPDGVGAADRSGAFVQPADLFATLADWYGLLADSGPLPCGPLAPPADSRQNSPGTATQSGRELAEQVGYTRRQVGQGSLLSLASGDVSALRDRAAIVSPSGEQALRTPAWYARFLDAERAELYLKPDDRWEVNDLACRCSDVVEAMRKALDDCQADTGAPRNLDEALVQGVS